MFLNYRSRFVPVNNYSNPGTKYEVNLSKSRGTFIAVIPLYMQAEHEC